MDTIFSPRKLSLIGLGLVVFGLWGCGKAETPGEAPPAASASATPAAPAASPAPVSATPNSFSEVTAQLDAGGDFYLYLSMAQWLGKVDRGIDALHQVMLANEAGQSPENLQKGEQAIATVKDMAKKSGLEDITGIGASSLNYAPGLYRNKLFVHHDPANGSGLIWSIDGKAPHALTGLDLLPVDTASAAIGDFDLAAVINFLRDEANQSGIPEVKDEVTQWQTQFAGLSGLQLDDVLASLSGTFGMVVTLDATATIAVPVGAQPVTMPQPRLAVLIAVNNDVVFKQVDKMLATAPAIEKVDEPDVRMRTTTILNMRVPWLRPTIAQWNGYLIVASDDKLVRDIIAVQKGTPGFKSTAEYATLSAGLPEQGNSFGVATQKFADTVNDLQTKLATLTPAAGMQAALMKRFQKTGHMMSVGSALPNGWLTVSQGSLGAAQILPALAIAPAAMAAGMYTTGMFGHP